MDGQSERTIEFVGIRDSLVERALGKVIGPAVETKLSDDVYSYRPRVSCLEEEEGFDRFHATRRYVANLAKSGSVAVISHKNCPYMWELIEKRIISENDYMWFGTLRGLNRFFW